MARKALSDEQKRRAALAQRAYRLRHPDRLRAHDRTYRKRPEYREVRNDMRKRWRLAHPEAHRAHIQVEQALRNGTLTKPDKCEKCGSNARLEGHHENYSQALDVQWLCRLCHAKHHEQTKGMVR